jgi:hypothetical protein
LKSESCALLFAAQFGQRKFLKIQLCFKLKQSSPSPNTYLINDLFCVDYLCFVDLNRENGCNIPPIKGASLDKPSEMMAFSLSISQLG